VRRTMLRERQPITLEEWRKRVQSRCRTISGRYLPLAGGEAYEWACKARNFIDQETYPVRFTDRRGILLVEYDDPEATPIRIAEFAKNREFVEFLLGGWYDSSKGPIKSAELLVQCCTTCNRRVVIDGAHNVVWIAVHGSGDEHLEISELTGCRWPDGMPDMSVVCSCSTIR